jgi:hypothetical protein
MNQGLHVATVKRDYSCARCGLYQHATVETVGFGVGAWGTADRNASRDADAAVPMLLALKRCPSCGYRSESTAARNLRTRRIAIGVIAVIFAATIAALGALAYEDRWLLWITVGVFPLLGFVTFAQGKMLARRYPTDVEDRVTLSDPPSVETWRPTTEDSPTTRDGGWKWI